MIILDTIATILAQDSVQSIVDVNKRVAETGCSLGQILGSFIDYAYKIAMVFIAIVNYIYVRRLNQEKDTKEQNKEQEERLKQKKAQRIEYLKTLVYDENLPKLYDFFVNLEAETVKLKSENADKKLIEKNLQGIFKDLRSKFIIVLSAAVPDLGNQIQDIADNLHDQLVSNMSDEGINIWVERYYNDLVKKVYEKGKIDMISALFNYDGQ